MYQNCCKKCGSTSLHTDVKGNNTGLYCDNCGSWVKWLSKDELRAFDYSKLHSNNKNTSKTYTKDEVMDAIDALKDYDNYNPFHSAADRVLEMFENMKEN